MLINILGSIDNLHRLFILVFRRFVNAVINVSLCSEKYLIGELSLMQALSLDIPIIFHVFLKQDFPTLSSVSWNSPFFFISFY